MSDAPTPSDEPPDPASEASTEAASTREGAEADRPVQHGMLWPTAAWFRTVGWVVLEFAIVFSGVFAAFQLDQWQADRRADRRAQQAYTALYRVISNIYADDLRRSARGIDSVYVEGFLTPFRQGEQPMPIALQFSWGTLNTGAWEAILEAGGLDALDTDFVLEVETYFSVLQATGQRARRVTAMSDERLLPHLDGGKTAFYHEDTGELKSAFRWYPRTVGQVASSVRNVAQATDSLLVSLERRIEERGGELPRTSRDGP